MLVKYVIHRIGTPKLAIKNHWSYEASEYWSNKYGWSYKQDATVFDTKDNWNLPLEGEWVEIYVNEPVKEKSENRN